MGTNKLKGQIDHYFKTGQSNYGSTCFMTEERLQKAARNVYSLKDCEDAIKKIRRLLQKRAAKVTPVPAGSGKKAPDKSKSGSDTDKTLSTGDSPPNDPVPVVGSSEERSSL